MAEAQSLDCLLKPNQIPSVVDRLIQSHWQKAEDQDAEVLLPNSLPIRTEIDEEPIGAAEGGTLSNGTGRSVVSRVHVEGFLRPRKTARFYIFKLITFRLERSRHLLYYCYTSDSRHPEKTRLTIYFLSGYGLDSSSWSRSDYSTLPGDWFFGPGGPWQGVMGGRSARVARVPVELIPVSTLTDGTEDLTEGIPGVSETIKIPLAVVNFSNLFLVTLNAQLGAGVERITVSEKGIEFANRVDLDHPENAHTVYRMDAKMDLQF